MPFDPDAYLKSKTESSQASGGFDPDAYLKNKTSKREEHAAPVSAVRKFLSGAYGGFSDELAGLGEAAGQAVGVKGFGAGDVTDMSLQKPTLDLDKLKAAYHEARDHERQMLKEDKEDHPTLSTVSELAGAVASPLNKATQGMGLIKAGALYGGVAGLGNSESEDLSGMAADTLQGTALGGGLGLAGAGAIKAGGAVANAAAPVLQKAGGKLKSVAEGLAEKATGATRVQAEKFEDGAGRELLDRGLVKFGDTPAKVAERVGAANDEAAGQISSALKKLDEKGVKASQDNIVNALEARAKELDKDPSQAAVAKNIRAKIEDIINTGSSEIPASAAESTKRGFGAGIKNWADPAAGKANKEAYLAYRDEVERAAKEAAPETADLFKKGKETFGLLSPVEEAAEKRAIQLKQSPIGGLGDFAAIGSGGAAAGPIGAVASVVGKRVIAPRIASSAAVTADMVSKALLRDPSVAMKAAADPRGFQAVVAQLVQKAHVDQAMPAAASNGPAELDRDSSRSSHEPIAPTPSPTPQPEPKRGTEKWASDGADAVAKVDPTLNMPALLANPKTKNLLIAASDLKPGSKAMNDVIAKLKSYGGSN